MLLILLSWIYVLFSAINFGILFKKIFKTGYCHIVITQVLGLFFYTIITTLAAFFIRINIEYYILVLILNIIIFTKYKTDIKQFYQELLNTFLRFKTSFKLLFLFLFLIILAQSSTKPYLLDNETYYIQTIKWLNEYGFVKGLANLHIYLGQNSSLHVLQAGFSFPFITDFFNDINGFLFTIFSFLAIDKLNRNTENKGFNYGLVLLFSLFLMQFINAPSPDLIAFLLAPYVFYLFIKYYNAVTFSEFKVILSLVLFLCFVKTTMAVLAVLVLILFIKHFSTLKNNISQYTILSGIILFLFLAKNAIISGYLLYPTTSLDILNVDWKLPKVLPEFNANGIFSVSMNNIDVSNYTFFETFKYWLTIPKLHGLFNKVFIILLVVFPFFIYKRKDKSPLFIVYILAILQLVILWQISPQYRFFFVFIMFLSIQLLEQIIRNKKVKNSLVFILVGISMIPVFFNINLNTFTNNSFAMELSQFKLKNVIIPEGNSKTITQFEKQNIDGFEYNSPGEEAYFWVTGNGDLPCVNKKQVEYFEYYYNYIPKLRSDNLKDGFKSVLVKKSDY